MLLGFVMLFGYAVIVWLVFFKFKVMTFNITWAIVSVFVGLHLLIIFLIGLRFVAPYATEAVMVQHTIHCIAHSAVIAAGVTLLLWAWRRALWLPLLGWWSHIVIDVFTHSADYYASPVLYPFTERGFDGIAWITPWFMALNYLALATAGIALLVSARRRSRSGALCPPIDPTGSST